MQRILLLILAVSLLLLLGCGPSVKVTRTNTDQTVDLSGRWNDTDASLTAQEMIKDVLSKPWYAEFVSDNDRKPVLIVGTVRNLSVEHIDATPFIDDMERELVNSGLVKFVASQGERAEIRQEVMEQQSKASEETAKRLAAETGADFILQGSIKTIIDAIEGKQVKYYQVDLQLVNLETSEKVWLNTKKIKKVVQRNKFKG